MNTSKDKIKGQVNTAAGDLKLAAGKVVGSDKLKLQGATQKLKGQAQKASGQAKGAINKGLNKIGESARNMGRDS